MTIRAGSGLVITGDKRLDRMFRDLPTNLRKKGARKATREVAKLTLKQARDLVPEDEGNLSRSLTVRAAKLRRRRQNPMVGTAVQTRDGFFQGDEFYGGFIEFGTAGRRTKSGAYRGRIEESLHAFLRPALMAALDRKRRIFRVVLARWLRTEAQKGRRR